MTRETNPIAEINQIIKKLRDCDPADIEGIVMNSSADKNSLAFALMYVIRGNIHTQAVYGRKHLYSLSETCLEGDKRFGLDKQLAAIDASAEVKSKEMLLYLRNLIDYSYEGVVEPIFSPDGITGWRRTGIRVKFPYAHRGIKKGLEIRSGIGKGAGSHSKKGVINVRLWEHEENALRKEIESIPYFQRIQSAIQKLETYFQN